MHTVLQRASQALRCSLHPAQITFPQILVHFVQRCRSLHESVILLTVRTEACAKMPPDEKYQLTDLGNGFWRLVLHFRYMEHPRVDETLTKAIENEHLTIDLKELTFYVGHERLTSIQSGKLGRVAEAIFAYLQRNAVDVESTFCLPPNQVVEI